MFLIFAVIVHTAAAPQIWICSLNPSLDLWVLFLEAAATTRAAQHHPTRTPHLSAAQLHSTRTPHLSAAQRHPTRTPHLQQHNPILPELCTFQQHNPILPELRIFQQHVSSVMQNVATAVWTSVLTLYIHSQIHTVPTCPTSLPEEIVIQFIFLGRLEDKVQR